MKFRNVISTSVAATVLLAAAAALHPAGNAMAQAWPAKPIHVVVPFTAGSTTDIIARAISDKLAASLGQPVVIDNKPGAGGTLGAAIVARAEPDGYTILIHSSSHTVNPATYQNLSFDTVRDFAGIAPIASLPNVLIVSPSKGYKSVQDLIAAAKAKPGTLNFASAGAGSATHLNAEKFRIGAGIDAVHIPFKGSPEAIHEVMGGRVDYYFAPAAPVVQLINEKKVIALAVGSPKRSSLFPNVPTTLEAGVPESEYNFWIGMLAPAKTPKPIIDRLYKEVQAALASTDVRERMARLGADPMSMTPEQFDQYVRDEIAANTALVKKASIKIQ